jgi:hypothetical protein
VFVGGYTAAVTAVGVVAASAAPAPVTRTASSKRKAGFSTIDLSTPEAHRSIASDEKRLF